MPCRRRRPSCSRLQRHTDRQSDTERNRRHLSSRVVVWRRHHVHMSSWPSQRLSRSVWNEEWSSWRMRRNPSSPVRDDIVKNLLYTLSATFTSELIIMSVYVLCDGLVFFVIEIIKAHGLHPSKRLTLSAVVILGPKVSGANVKMGLRQRHSIQRDGKLLIFYWLPV